MKKLTAKEVFQLTQLLRRAAENGQLAVGVNTDPNGLSSYSTQNGIEVVCFRECTGEAPDDDCSEIDVLMPESGFKSLRGIMNRAKASNRQLTSEQARKMAQKRHESQ